LIRITFNLIFGALLYAAAVFSSEVYYIPAALMTIAFGLYLSGLLIKQQFKRSFLTFYIMLGTFAASLPGS
jgi:hypothetical protein